MRHRETAARTGRRQHPRRDMPMFRNLWENIRPKMPKKGRGKAAELDPLKLPIELRRRSKRSMGITRRRSSYGKRSGIPVPPCFIVVCNNTSTSKLVYDYISGFHRNERRWLQRLSRMAVSTCSAISTSTATRSRGPHAPDRQRTARIGRGARRQFPRDRAPEIEQFRREMHGRTGDRQQGARTSPIRTCCAK